MGWTRNDKTGTYRLDGTNLNIKKSPSGKITKGYGWDLYDGIHKMKHFDKLSESKKFAQELSDK